jgi:NAD(P)H-hydrate epimerase
MKTISVDQMKSAEKAADLRGETSPVLMEKAGYGLYRMISQRFSGLADKQVAGLIGSGNNGGDALIALTHLRREGWNVRVCLFNRKIENDLLIKNLADLGGMILQANQEDDIKKLTGELWQTGILLDGILGTGIRLPLRDTIARPIEIINSALRNIHPKPMVIAVDCPSGMNCDSGEAAIETIPADLTLCLGAIKKGLVTQDAIPFCGEIEGIDIGIDDLIPTEASMIETITQTDVQSMIPERTRSGYKGTYGKALIIAGSVNYTGAAYLAGSGALRSGAGWVTLAVASDLHSILAGMLPEATWLLLSSEMGVISQNALPVIHENLTKYNAVLIGCGLGLEKTTAQFFKGVIDHRKESGRPFGFIPREENANPAEEPSDPAMIIDADGLKLLAQIPQWEKELQKNSILTPHPGEMALLTGMKVEEIQKDRVQTAQKFARKWGQVVVLKGPGTIIADPDGRCAVIPIATSALAHAGTGDVLAGMITGLRAQGMDAFQAAAAGAWIHARSGMLAEQKTGNRCVLAGDLPGLIREVLE